MTTVKLNLERLRPCPQWAVSRADPRRLSAFARWRQRIRQREELTHLDARTQRDLGLSDADIWLELQRPGWGA